MSKTTINYISLGKIGTSYGVNGWLKVSTYTEDGPSILDYAPWYISGPGQDWKIVEVEEGKVHGKGLVVKLAGINTPEEARLFTGMLIGVPRSQLPSLPQNEFYWTDLIGLTVINTAGKTLGKVVYLMETGSNDVLVVKDDKEHAIPYLPGQVILNVDLEKKEILVDWELL